MFLIEELHNQIHGVITLTKRRRLRLAGHVAQKGRTGVHTLFR
jgi:hypothetical protein